METPLGLTVRDVVECERVRHQAFFCVLLPLANPQEPLDAATFVRSESRPDCHDFDLFKTTEQARSMDDRLLRELISSRGTRCCCRR